jgi:hypothetical protein
MSFGRSRQIEYGVDSSFSLMAAMRRVGGVNPSTGATAADVKDAEKRGNPAMG